MADNVYSVFATYSISKGTQFGPLQAKKLCTLLPTICFPLRVFCETQDDLSEYFLDVSDENECNWMMFVNPANDFQEQNIVCYQDNEDIYFVTVKDVCEGEALKVWYSPYYATKMQKDVLKPVINKDVQNLKNNETIDNVISKKKNISPRDTWSCKFCGKMERSLSEFALHLMKHYCTKLGRYCQICNVSFVKIEGYQKHMKIVHETDIANRPSINSDSKSNTIQKLDLLPKENYFGGPLLLNELLNDSMDNTSLVLPQIDLTGIENQNNLFDNENLNLNVESILPESVKDLDNFNFELVENENELFVCDICLKTFRKLRRLIVHMNMHTGKYTCFECNKVFARNENLNYHSCKVFYKLQCSYCPKLFYQKKYLVNHVKKFHNNNKAEPTNSTESIQSRKKFSCTECSKTFTCKTNLFSHLKLHQAREKYTCPICHKILGSQKTYLKHYKIHEEPTHKCQICERAFKRQDSLKYHIDNVHSAKIEICVICKKVVKSKKLLKIHMQIHEDKSFKCSQCSLKFKQRHNLIRHVKIHHETDKGIQSFFSNIDKQYPCPKCDKKLKWSKSLKKHLETVHPDENIDYKMLKLKKTNYKRQSNFSKQVDDSVMDLKQTIENMNYSTDEINHEITTEIDKLLNNPENFGSESNDRLVESLINSVVGETSLEHKPQQKDPMLSMPNLEIDDDMLNEQ